MMGHNFFGLAAAVAVAVSYLACIQGAAGDGRGVLVEVPVMLSMVWLPIALSSTSYISDNLFGISRLMDLTVSFRSIPLDVLVIA